MPDENSQPKIELDNRIVTYLETLLNRISGWGCVTIRVSNGKIAFVECTSEQWKESNQ